MTKIKHSLLLSWAFAYSVAWSVNAIADHCTGYGSDFYPIACLFTQDYESRQNCFEQDDNIQTPGWREPAPFSNECEVVLVEYSDACHLEQWIHHDDSVNSSWSETWGGPWWTCEGGGDPIVFDLEGNGFSFTDPNIQPVQFDLDGDGTLDSLAWTTQNSDDSFLVLDKNGNHKVDNGTELFGNGTMLLSGQSAPIGFVALKELDQIVWGGNSDGFISKDDQQFQKMRLWADKNQNGISESNELITLMSQGIQSIDLSYSGSLNEDEFGNGLYFNGSSQINVQGQIESISILDVFLRSGN